MYCVKFYCCVVETALRISFDEKTVFPKYILDYEVKMRRMQGKAKAVQAPVCIAACHLYGLDFSRI